MNQPHDIAAAARNILFSRPYGLPRPSRVAPGQWWVLRSTPLPCPIQVASVDPIEALDGRQEAVFWRAEGASPTRSAELLGDPRWAYLGPGPALGDPAGETFASPADPVGAPPPAPTLSEQVVRALAAAVERSGLGAEEVLLSALAQWKGPRAEADSKWLQGFEELVEEDARRVPSPLELERRALYGHDLDRELTDFAAGRHPVQRQRVDTTTEDEAGEVQIERVPAPPFTIARALDVMGIDAVLVSIQVDANNLVQAINWTYGATAAPRLGTVAEFKRLLTEGGEAAVLQLIRERSATATGEGRGETPPTP